MKKPELLRLAGLHREKKQLEVEKELEGTPHKILWLPPYHAIFNAIELVSCLGTPFGTYHP